MNAYFYHVRVFGQGSGIPLGEVSGLYWGEDTSIAFNEVLGAVKRDYSPNHPDGIDIIFISFYSVR